MARTGSQISDLELVAGRLREWQQQLPAAATAARSAITEFLAEVDGYKSHWLPWTAAQQKKDLVERARGLEARRESLSTFLIDLSGIAREIEGVEPRLEQLGGSPPTQSIRMRIDKARSTIEHLHSVRLSEDAIAVNRRLAKQTGDQVQADAQAVRLLADGEAMMARLDDATAQSLRMVMTGFRTLVENVHPTLQQLQDFSLQLEAARPAPVPVAAPSAGGPPQVEFHLLEHLLSDSRGWVEFAPSIADAEAEVQGFQERLEQLRRRPDRTGADHLHEALTAFGRQMAEALTLQKEQGEKSLGLDLRLLGSVRGTQSDLEERFEALRRYRIEAPSEWAQYATEYQRLQRQFDDRVQTSLADLVQAWKHLTATVRDAIALVMTRPRLRSIHARLESLHRDLDRHAYADGQTAWRARTVLDSMRALDDFRQRVESIERERRSEVDAFQRSVADLRSRAAAWVDIGGRSGTASQMADVLAGCDAITDDLVTRGPLLETIAERLKEMTATLDVAVERFQQLVLARAARAGSEHVRYAEQLEACDCPIPPPPPSALAAPRDLAGYATLVGGLDRWSDAIAAAMGDAVRQFEGSVRDLLPRLVECASHETMDDDDRSRALDLVERQPQRLGGAAPTVDEVRAFREWHIEAEAFLDSIHRDTAEVRASIDWLRQRARQFREHGFNRLYEEHYRRLQAMVDGLDIGESISDDLRYQVHRAVDMLTALERDAMSRVAHRTTHETEQLRRLIDQVRDDALKERARKILREIDRVAPAALPSYSQRNALSMMLQTLRR